MAMEENSDPDCPQMIMEAIQALNEPEGSSEFAISNYIESNYSDLTLTFAHSTLLSNTLEKLKQTGDLVLSNGNYLKREEHAPATKRGRGRPAKPKDPSAKEDVVARSRDQLAPVSESKNVSGRPRGRPRKYPKDDEGSPAVVTGVKRGRGRPPKIKA